MSDRRFLPHLQRRRSTTAFTLAAVTTALLSFAACRTGPSWILPDALRVSDHAVAVALDDVPPAPTVANQSTQLAIPALPMPRHTRPCCAFGTNLEASLGGVIVPGYSLDNLRAVRDLGPHRYDNGVLTIAMNDERGWIDSENNGLVFTCRGGFVDTAHVRDYADVTVYLSLSIARQITTGGEVPLANEGGERRVRVRAVDPATIAGFGRRANDVREGRLAAEIATWAAFQASIWHEIATWYGYYTMQGFPEMVSSFSPEDLYSNQLGVRIARAIQLERGLIEAASYDRRIDVWVRRVLHHLDARPKRSGEKAMFSVDGAWWDSSRRLPDWRLVKRRYFEIGPLIEPMLVPGSDGFGCKTTTALSLEVREGVAGIRFDELATLEIDVDPKLVRAGLPLPERGNLRITQAAFPAIIEAIRHENDAAFAQASGAGGRP